MHRREIRKQHLATAAFSLEASGMSDSPAPRGRYTGISSMLEHCLVAGIKPRGHTCLLHTQNRKHTHTHTHTHTRARARARTWRTPRRTCATPMGVRRRLWRPMSGADMRNEREAYASSSAAEASASPSEYIRRKLVVIDTINLQHLDKKGGGRRCDKKQRKETSVC